MKKLLSLITGGMLTAMSVMPLATIAESNTEITDNSFASSNSDSYGVSLTSTQATIKQDELKVTFCRNQPEYNVYVGEQINLNDIIFNLYVYGYTPDGTFIPEPIALDYSFSIGSGKHSDCYNYYLGYVDTSKPGRYLIQCKLNGNFKEIFDIENSGCPYIPDGKYEMTMSNDNFTIPVNVIDPNISTDSTFVATTTATSTGKTVPDLIVIETDNSHTTAVTDDIQPATSVLPPIQNEIRAMYTCQETYTVNVGEKFNPDDIELSVSARSAVPNQYQIDYKFTIGSGKHSDCFTYDTGDVDTSKPGTYYVKVTVLPDVKDTYVIDGEEYEMITEGIKMISMIPVYVREPAPTDFVAGDANGDGTVDIADAAAIIQYLGNKNEHNLSEQGKINADCYNTGDGITGMDALAIQKLRANLIKELPEMPES